MKSIELKVWELKIRMIKLKWREKEVGLKVQVNQESVMKCGWDLNIFNIFNI